MSDLPGSLSTSNPLNVAGVCADLRAISAAEWYPQWETAVSAFAWDDNNQDKPVRLADFIDALVAELDDAREQIERLKVHTSGLERRVALLKKHFRRTGKRKEANLLALVAERDRLLAGITKGRAQIGRIRGAVQFIPGDPDAFHMEVAYLDDLLGELLPQKDRDP